MRKVAMFLALAVATFGLYGCPPAEEQARDAIAGAHGWIVNAQAAWGDSCRANTAQAKCISTNKLIEAQHLAATALQAYCAGPAAVNQTAYVDGGPCVPIKGATDALKSAVVNMNTFVSQVKDLLKKGA